MQNPVPSQQESDPDFRALFESIPALVLVLRPPDLTIVAVSDAHLSATMTKRSEVLGRNVFDIFPDNPDDPSQASSSSLRASLETVIRTKAPDTMAVLKYDVRRPESEGGQFEERFWSVVNSPVLGANNEIRYIMNRAEEVTELVRLNKARREESERTAELRSLTDLMEQEVALRGLELERANKELVAANSAKSDFLAKMSHDIRTPLNGIVGMCDLLLGTALSEQQHRYSQILKSSANSLSALITDILDFSKIEAGKLELEEIDFDLHSSVEEVSTTLSYQASKKGLELICYIHPHVPLKVCGDPDRLWQVLVNLVNNAVKFTEAGQIIIRVRLDEKSDAPPMIRFEISDTGIGIPPESLDRLFKAFSQADISTTRQYGGSGLGLAISKQIVQLMGGQIGVDSIPGEGSTFWFTMILKETPKAALRPSVQPNVLKETRILLVDDNSVNLEILQQQIADLGMTAEVASGGAEALRLLVETSAKNLPQLAVVDYQMPGMNGIELGKAIKSNESTKNIALILLTSVESELDLVGLKKFGFASLMTKPVRQSMLLNTILSALSHGSGGSVSKAAAPRVSADRSLGSILVAEDNEINQIVISEILSSAGYQCDLVGDGEVATTAALTGKYDLVLMDCEMPRRSGLEATERIRAEERAKSVERPVPIIAFTANAQTTFRDKCLQSGMNGFCSKPVNQEQLLETIQSHLPKKNARAIDLAAFLPRCMNNPGTARVILEKFKTQLIRDLETLSSSAKQRDWKSTATIAHGMLGVAGTVGAEEIARIAGVIEEFAQKENLQIVDECMEQLREAVRKCLESLPAVYAELETASR